MSKINILNKNILIKSFQENDSEYITSLLIENSHFKNDSVWKIMEYNLILSLLKVLVYLRDKNEIQLNSETLKLNLTIEKSTILANRKDIPKEYRNGLYNYLFNLPEYRIDKQKQTKTAYEHHYYISMGVLEKLEYLK